MREYFPVNLIMNSNNYYCIWFTNGKDGLITELSKIKFFFKIEDLLDYAKANNIQINDEQTELCFNTAINWLKNKRAIDCRYFLDYWNMITDITSSLKIRFFGNKKTKHVCKIYDKLFYGCNLPAISGNEEIYIPKWTKKEMMIFTKIVKDGLRVVYSFLA